MKRNDRSCYFSDVGKGKQTRQAIIDRAMDEARAVGLDAVTLGTLADDLSISKSGLFAHFKSKEALQLAVVDASVERYIADVVRPAIREPRGEPRVRALFERYLEWDKRGCPFMAMSFEYDDRPGPIRDRIVEAQNDWLAAVARAASVAIDERHFRADLDSEQFAYEFIGIGMSFHHHVRLLGDPRAREKARQAFDALLNRSRAA